MKILDILVKPQTDFNDPNKFKAVFLVGGPCSGKAFVANTMLNGTSLRPVNCDEIDSSFAYNRVGLLLPSNGRDVEKVQAQLDMVEKLGYDTIMLFVTANLEVTHKRNQEGNKRTPAELVTVEWNQAQDNLIKFKEIFNQDNFHVIDTSENTQDAGRKYKLEAVANSVYDFLNTPPSSKQAKHWSHSNNSIR